MMPANREASRAAAEPQDFYQETRFGFRWNAAEIRRLFSHNGMVVLRVNDVEVYVSPKGKRTRVFRNGRELK